MDVKIEPKRLCGTIPAISSKSDVHRLLICAMQGDRATEIFANGISEDIEATVRCIRAMGAEVHISEGKIEVIPKKYTQKPQLDCGESGSTARFLLPLVSALCGGGELIGGGRLPKRPFSELTDQMRLHGCRVSSDNIPIVVDGKITSGRYELPGDVSSQYISALLMTLPTLSGDSTIFMKSRLESSGYVDMTIDTLRKFGIEISKSENGFEICGNQKYISPKSIVADGDWSNGAFFIAAKFLGSDVSVENLSISSIQGDRKIVDILENVNPKEWIIDASEIPDLVPILAVCGTCLSEKTIITNASRLRIKESDRLSSTESMITSLGGHAVQTDDGLQIWGELTGGTVDSFNDHRIVMSAAIASTVCKKTVLIHGGEAVNKSYPRFFEDFKRLGGVIHV